jgi:hypothetical protein
MIRENHLLPWILGGLSLAAIATAVTVGSFYRTAPKKLPVPIQVAALAPTPAIAPAVPVPAPPPAPATADPAPDPSLALEPVQPVGATIASGSQIWECTTNGLRTFSDKPCGGNSTLREMNPLNVMNPAPMSPPVRPYAPESNNAPEYYYPSAQDTVESSYPMVVGYPYPVRRRPDHTRRPYHPHPMPMPR